ncbi:hypothetical protein DVH24_035672 [Malus domestica]|uniref:RNase H type-1 domain-containing protein n=1 Tax=Malus domestica TaxID=3750 RepID=A0A498JT55_MALDO|nr:hypothetical protein DVH24_035672 [Malus domestica]
MRSISHIKLTHTRREANKVAHRLARLGLTLDKRIIWFDEPLDVNLLLEDMQTAHSVVLLERELSAESLEFEWGAMMVLATLKLNTADDTSSVRHVVNDAHHFMRSISQPKLTR